VDGDGFPASVEQHVGTSVTVRCGDPDTSKPGRPSRAWAADLQTTGTTFRIDIQDLASFLAPVRRLGTSPGDPNYDARWDIVPGQGPLSTTINTLDIGFLVTFAPPMLNGQRAFGGPACTG
jgi:hypothetical protein